MIHVSTTRTQEERCFVLACSYVDDIIKLGRKLTEVKTGLSRKFDIKDLGKLNYFLGMKIEQRENNSVWIGQLAYIERLTECKTANQLIR
jgi:hypothetical protein